MNFRPHFDDAGETMTDNWKYLFFIFKSPFPWVQFHPNGLGLHGDKFFGLHMSDSWFWKSMEICEFFFLLFGGGRRVPEALHQMSLTTLFPGCVISWSICQKGELCSCAFLLTVNHTSPPLCSAYCLFQNLVPGEFNDSDIIQKEMLQLWHYCESYETKRGWHFFSLVISVKTI